MGKKLLLLVVAALNCVHAESPVGRSYLPPAPGKESGYAYNRPDVVSNGNGVGTSGGGGGRGEFDDLKELDASFNSPNIDIERVSIPSSQYSSPSTSGRVEEFSSSPSSEYGTPSRLRGASPASLYGTPSSFEQFRDVSAPSSQYGVPLGGPSRLTASNQFGSIGPNQNRQFGLPSVPFGRISTAAAPSVQYGTPSRSSANLRGDSNQYDTSSVASSRFSSPSIQYDKPSVAYDRFSGPSTQLSSPSSSARLLGTSTPSSVYGVPNGEQRSQLRNDAPSADVEDFRGPSRQYGAPTENNRMTSKVSIRIGGNTANANPLTRMSYTTSAVGSQYSSLGTSSGLNNSPSTIYGTPSRFSNLPTATYSGSSQLNNGPKNGYSSAGQINVSPSAYYGVPGQLNNGNSPFSGTTSRSGYSQPAINGQNRQQGDITSGQYSSPARLSNTNGYSFDRSGQITVPGSYSTSPRSEQQNNVPDGRFAAPQFDNGAGYAGSNENKRTNSNNAYSLSSRLSNNDNGYDSGKTGQFNNVPSNSYGAPDRYRSSSPERLNSGVGNSYSRNNGAELLNNGYPSSSQPSNSPFGGQLNSALSNGGQYRNNALGRINTGNGYQPSGALRQNSLSTQYGTPDQLRSSTSPSRLSSPTQQNGDAYAPITRTAALNQYGAPGNDFNEPSTRYGVPEEAGGVETLDARLRQPSRLTDDRTSIPSRQQTPDGLYGAPAARSDPDGENVEILGEEDQPVPSLDALKAGEFQDDYQTNQRYTQNQELQAGRGGPY